MKIWFDMDGTIVDLYAVEGWLDMLRAYDETPYEMARPLVKMNALARQLNAAQRNGHEIGVISWLSKCSNADYDAKVTAAKLAWLEKHLPSVKWDAVLIVPYGTPKYETCGCAGILFDDEQRNRDNWLNGCGFDPDKITKILSEINKNMRKRG